jgi:hypothetical protein
VLDSHVGRMNHPFKASRTAVTIPRAATSALQMEAQDSHSMHRTANTISQDFRLIYPLPLGTMGSTAGAARLAQHKGMGQLRGLAQQKTQGQSGLRSQFTG